jgi:hypothetical protein
VVLTTTGPAGLVFGIRATVSGAFLCAGTVALGEGSKILSSAVLDAGAGFVDFSTFQNPQIPDGPHTVFAGFSTSGLNCGPGVSEPTIFTADGSGSGAPIGILVTAHADGSQDSHAAYECSSPVCRTLEVDVANSTDTNVLVLYATGVRNARLQDVTAGVDSVDTSVLFAGAQSQFPGLDQINVQLPSSLAGHGEVTLQVIAAGKQANAVKIRFR